MKIPNWLSWWKSVEERERYKTYLFTYRFDGHAWEFQILAKSQEEALARLRCIKFNAEYSGELIL